MVEPLAVLLLPSRLEDFEFEAHARGLLAIARVLALEPARFRTPRLLREAAPVRTAKRLRFPGEPRLFVLYHPAQYRLARALCARYEHAELWYLAAHDTPAGVSSRGQEDELDELDQLASARATERRLIAGPDELAEAEEALRRRLGELGIFSHRPFIPGARVERRSGP